MRKYKRQENENYKYTLANLNLRENKSTSSNVITVIPAKSKIEVLDAPEDWYDVRYNGQRGYVFNEYLSKT